MRLFMSPGFVADVGRRAMESIASERPKIKSARLSIRGRGRLSLPPGRSRPSPPAKGGIDKVALQNRLAYLSSSNGARVDPSDRKTFRVVFNSRRVQGNTWKGASS